MRKLSATISILPLFLPFTVFASSAEHELARLQYRAVEEAVHVQHKIADNETLHALINRSRPYADTKRIINTFAIQYVDAAGKCTFETVDVALELATLKTDVQFFKIPRMECW